MSTECMYCKCSLEFTEHFVVRRAVKPPYAPRRWQKIGACCDSCEAAGKPTSIEYKQQ
ncbi:hypothetical protein [Noviherbaspirillum galbum]|uniref:Uncharacterized protein n=1 Tax=Noviherbaspirillum galbum TaxID=2709383 RepID=A0A6B3SNX1_9BURK|nr:hypothetical protein [Noviherbaspirillum galbum]NEX60162.1 hypothetical protein [Noviherbaspirillum galbum]